MPSAFAWLFNNPLDSDLTIVITNENPSSSPDRTPTDSEIGSNEKSSDAPVTRILHAHKLVLNTYSEYFRARNAHRWQSPEEEVVQKRGTRGGRGSRGGKTPKGTKRTRDDMEDGTPKVVLNVATADLVPLAEAMVKYMYLEELGQQGIVDLLKLIQLADEYGVVPLIAKCVTQAQDVGFDKWSMTDKLAAVELPEPLLANSEVKELVAGLKQNLWTNFKELKEAAALQSGSSKSTAAAALMEYLLGDYLDLEAAWNDTTLKERLLSWPFPAVDALLGRDDLKVASENIVLVVALSWLRTKGKFYMKENGPQLLQRVRFPQLQPWFIALMTRAWNSGPKEIRDLLSIGVIEHLGYYMRADEHDRARFHEKPLCADWGKARQKLAAKAQFTARINVSDIQKAAKFLQSSPQEGISERVICGRSKYVDGLLCKPGCFLSRYQGGAELSMGVVADVHIPGTLPLVSNYEGLPVEFVRLVTIENKHMEAEASDEDTTHFGHLLGVCVVEGISLQDPMPALAPFVKEGVVGPFTMEYEIM